MTDHAVDRAAQAEFNALMEFVKILKARDRRRGGTSASSRRENKALDRLLAAFEQTADSYFGKAQELIRTDGKAPTKKAEEYRRVLSRLSDHLLLLSDLARSPLAAEGDLGRKRALVERVMNVIATRFNSNSSAPLLMLSQHFKYINFQYMRGIAVIGVPPQILAVPSWNLSLLWHEIAGHSIAQKRAEGALKTWAEALDQWARDNDGTPVWETFHEENVKVQVSLDELVTGIEYVPEDEESPLRIVEDLKSQDFREVWLGEFCEDLFGVQALGGAMVEALADALAQRYERLDVGDASHPPPNLRIQVARDYLDLVAPGVSDQVRTNLQERYALEQANGLEQLQLEALSPPLKEAAKTIAAFYKDKVDNDEFSRQEISNEEKQLARVIGDAYERFMNPAEPEGDLEELWGKLEKIEATVSFNPESKVDDFRNKIRNAPNLDSLLELAFAEDDFISFPEFIRRWLRRTRILIGYPRDV